MAEEWLQLTANPWISRLRVSDFFNVHHDNTVTFSHHSTEPFTDEHDISAFCISFKLNRAGHELFDHSIPDTTNDPLQIDDLVIVEIEPEKSVSVFEQRIGRPAEPHFVQGLAESICYGDLVDTKYDPKFNGKRILKSSALVVFCQMTSNTHLQRIKNVKPIVLLKNTPQQFYLIS